MKVASIRINGGTQPRVSIDQDAVNDYAAALKSGIKFPPVVVFHDGADYWLADGFHRWHAHNQAKLANIAVDLRDGTKRDAVLYSVGVNAEHGLRRSNADKRKAVATLLTDPEWTKWSDREVAKRCAVGPDLVADVRRSLAEPVTVGTDSEDSRKYLTKHGTASAMKTGAINAGRQSAAQKKAADAWEKDKPADAADVTQADAAPDVADELRNAYGAIESLETRVAALAADDKAKEIDKQMRLREQAQSKVDEVQRTNIEMQKQIKGLQRREQELLKLTGARDWNGAIAFVRSLIPQRAA